MKTNDIRLMKTKQTEFHKGNQYKRTIYTIAKIQGSDIKTIDLTQNDIEELMTQMIEKGIEGYE